MNVTKAKKLYFEVTGFLPLTFFFFKKYDVRNCGCRRLLRNG